MYLIFVLWNIHKQFLNLIFILFDTHLFFRLEVTSSFSPVVLNLCSIEPQGFGESVSGFRRQEILSNKTKKKIHDTHFILPTTKGSIIARMKLVGFSTSNKRTTLHLNTAVTSISILLLLSIVKEEFNLVDQFCFVLHGCVWSPYRFVIYNIERKHGLRSMIFYDTKVIPECDSRHSLSCFFLLSESDNKPD